MYMHEWKSPRGWTELMRQGRKPLECRPYAVIKCGDLICWDNKFYTRVCSVEVFSDVGSAMERHRVFPGMDIWGSVTEYFNAGHTGLVVMVVKSERCAYNGKIEIPKMKY